MTVNGNALASALMGIRATAAALQHQTEAALALLGIGEQAAGSAEQVLSAEHKVFGGRARETV